MRAREREREIDRSIEEHGGGGALSKQEEEEMTR